MILSGVQGGFMLDSAFYVPQGASHCHEQEVGTQSIGKFPSLQKMRIYCDLTLTRQ